MSHAPGGPGLRPRRALPSPARVLEQLNLAAVGVLNLADGQFHGCRSTAIRYSYVYFTTRPRVRSLSRFLIMDHVRSSDVGAATNASVTAAFTSARQPAGVELSCSSPEPAGTPLHDHVFEAWAIPWLLRIRPGPTNALRCRHRIGHLTRWLVGWLLDFYQITLCTVHVCVK
eukprot:SAG22_NODE_5122_length_1081_cov_2.292261_1_plen_172_part_00